jgi:hypothetical protein
MVIIVAFYRNGISDEYSRSFPGGIEYAVDRSKELLEHVDWIDGYFIYNDHEVAIVEREIYFYQNYETGDRLTTYIKPNP